MQYIAVGDSVSVSLSSSRESLNGTVASMETTSSSESVSSVTYTVNVTVDNASVRSGVMIQHLYPLQSIH